MSLLFIGLSIPILIFILIYNYNKNSAGMVSILNEAVAQTSQAGVERTQYLIENTESPLRLLAEVAAADPGYFRTEQSSDLLYRGPDLGRVHRRRLCQFRGRLSPGGNPYRRGPPEGRSADPRDRQLARQLHRLRSPLPWSTVRHRTFYDIWPHEVGKYDVATDTDIRALPGYQFAKATHTLAVTEPSINPDTGFPIISLRIPIFRGVEFLGCASANITGDRPVTLSRQASRQRSISHIRRPPQPQDHCLPG